MTVGARYYAVYRQTCDEHSADYGARQCVFGGEIDIHELGRTYRIFRGMQPHIQRCGEAMTIDQLRTMRDRLITEIASGRKGCGEKRRQLLIVVAGIVALEIKQRQAT